MIKKILYLWMMLITSFLYAQSQDLTIHEKDGNQTMVSIENIMKMTRENV